MRGIYSSVPLDLNSDTIKKRKFILEYLKENKEKYVRAKALCTACGFSARATQAELRKAITYLIEVDNEPIVAGARGFCYTNDSNRLRFYSIKLFERMQGIQRR